MTDTITRHITFRFLLVTFSVLLLLSCDHSEKGNTEWPTIARETKPWTRWWWHGSAVTKEGITAEMEAYKKAGIGGLEITPIYGVYGQEDQFVDYLSPRWMELLMHTLKEAERLDMGIDMATGTGWPFGGPWVNDEDACKNLNYKVYEVKAGETLREKIEFIQEPYVRAVGNQIYEVHDNTLGNSEIPTGTRKEPLTRLDPKKITIDQLVEPVSSNKNLQALALDQVKFKKRLALKILMAYNESGKKEDLTKLVDADGKLNWVAPEGSWKLYAVFEGWHGKMVERAAPGGEGNVIDHFSANALKNYLTYFDNALKDNDIKTLRAFFNDSYEVDDARGSADWTPTLFEEFKKRRGYDLKEHLPALFGKDEEEKNKRVLCDYRETISELLLNNFTLLWREWAHSRSAIIRNQAHGSPANILDLYATVDIPEIEGIEPLRIKMASSAGNVTGKKLVASESATWLDEHFESNLASIKVAVDKFLLNGVNHIFYHGTCYSPPEEPWPGRLFYAAVHLNPRNSLWDDFDALNTYVTRCQSFLQNSKPDNDVLVYLPIYDRFSTPGAEMIEHFDGIGRQFQNTPFERSAESMHAKGYTFDFISDKQIQNCLPEDGLIKAEGGSTYKTIVLPHPQFIPITTFRKIISLAEAGATVIAFEGLPESVSGYTDLEKNKKEFDELLNKIGKGQAVHENSIEYKVGRGMILTGNNIDALLKNANVNRENLTDAGLQFIRKKGRGNRTLYFIANSNDIVFEGWLPLQSKDEFAYLYNPMTGRSGGAETRKAGDGNLEVYVQLAAKETLIIETSGYKIGDVPFDFYKSKGTPVALSGTWKISFETGGPQLPASVETDSLMSWTLFSDKSYSAFSGTTTYSLSFSRPKENAKGWILDLGKVKETARVLLNGKSIATLIGPTFQVYIDAALFDDQNILEVKVSNLMANRISDMDKRGIFWKKFYNVNFPARKAENRKNGLFDASHWQPKESGLLGPVYLIPVL